MDAFHMEIAGTVIRVQPMFESTREYCRAYLTDREPEILVEVTPEDLVREQILLEQEALEEGIRIRKYQGPFLERATIQRKVAQQLVPRNILMMHGSTVAVDGVAYLFTAPCGTGKSTHTRLWREVFGQRAVMVNDDKPFLKITGDGVLAYGSPWCGKHGLGTNICAPLKGICILHRDKENRIGPAAPEDVRDILYHQAHGTAAQVDMVMERISLWELYCNKEPEAAMVSYCAMKV